LGKLDEISFLNVNGGIGNPFDHAMASVHIIQYALRKRFVNDLIRWYREQQPDQKDIWEEIRKFGMEDSYESIESEVSEYHTAINADSEKYRKRYTGGNYNCSYEQADLKFVLTFKDVRGKRATIRTSLDFFPIYVKLVRWSRFPARIINLFAPGLKAFEWKVELLIGGGKPEHLLFYKTYFEIIPELSSTLARVSNRYALKVANERYKYYDTKTDTWPDKFELLADLYRKWVERQTPFLTKVLSPSRTKSAK
jgi:hypothetical protein